MITRSRRDACLHTTTFAALAMILVATGCSSSQGIEHNKTMARRAFTEAWSQGDLATADEVYHPDFTYRINGTTQLGRESYKQFIAQHRSAMPDLDFELKNVLGEGDEVVVYWEAKGTQSGYLGDMPATNRAAVVEGITILEFKEGSAVAEWTTWDEHGFFDQLGALRPR